MGKRLFSLYIPLLTYPSFNAIRTPSIMQGGIIMSHVTDIILVTAIDDYGAENLCRNLIKIEKMFSIDECFVKVDKLSGGNRAMQCDCFLAAMRNLDIEKFLKEFHKIYWEYPECAQLMLKDEDEDLFTIHYSKFLSSESSILSRIPIISK